jgi:hypothetical protein
MTLTAAAVFVGSAFWTSFAAGGFTSVINVTGDPIAGGNGTIDRVLSLPVVHSVGPVLYRASLAGTSGGTSDDTAVLYSDTFNPTRVVAREGSTVPGGNGTFSEFETPVLAYNRWIVFGARLAGTSGGAADNRGVYRERDGLLEEVFRAGQAAPDGNGVFASVDANIDYSDINSNLDGRVAFLAELTNTAGGPGAPDTKGIYRFQGPIRIQVARGGQAPPDGIGTFENLHEPVLNDGGQVGFSATIAGAGPASAGIFRGNGISQTEMELTQIVRRGEAAPDGNGTFEQFSERVTMGESLEVAFWAKLTGTANGALDDQGIYRANGITPIYQVARTGETAPSGNGVFSSFQSGGFEQYPATFHEVVFFAELTGTSGGTTDNTGIFQGTGNNDLVELVRKGQASPDGNGTFSEFGNTLGGDIAAVDYEGTIAFWSRLAGTSGGTTDDEGIFVYDDYRDIMWKVAREGDSLLGSTIVELGFEAGEHLGHGLSGYGLEQIQHVAYRFVLADGREGVAVWARVPEPGDLMLVSVAVGGLGLIGARGRFEFCRR